MLLKMVGVNELTVRSKAEQLALDLRWTSDRALTSEEKEHYALRRRLIREEGLLDAGLYLGWWDSGNSISPSRGIFSFSEFLMVGRTT